MPSLADVRSYALSPGSGLSGSGDIVTPAGTIVSTVANVGAVDGGCNIFEAFGSIVTVGGTSDNGLTAGGAEAGVKATGVD